jgi:hypothetical protein
MKTKMKMKIKMKIKMKMVVTMLFVRMGGLMAAYSLKIDPYATCDYYFLSEMPKLVLFVVQVDSLLCMCASRKCAQHQDGFE